VTDTYLTKVFTTPYLMSISNFSLGGSSAIRLQISKNGSFTNASLYTITDNRNGTFTTTIIGTDSQTIGALTNCTYLNNQGGDQFITMTIGGSASVTFWTFNGVYSGGGCEITIYWPRIVASKPGNVTSSGTINDTMTAFLTSNRTINNISIDGGVMGYVNLVAPITFSVTTSATNVTTITFQLLINGASTTFTRTAI